MSEVLRLEHGIRTPRDARRWIMQRCQEWECDAIADSAALMVSELVTNVFLHARTSCLVTADFDFPTLSVSVTDEAGEHALTLQPTPDGAIGGRGLAIVAELSDAWGVRHDDGTKSVWFHLDSTPRPGGTV